MHNPAREVPRSLVPGGLERLETEVVDIYPVPKGATVTISRNRSLEQIPVMSAEEKRQYGKALQGEVEFLNGRGLQAPLLQNTEDVEAVHETFVKGGFGKLGLREIKEQQGSVTADYVVVPQPAYLRYSESTNEKLREFGANLGAALYLVTADNKLVLQHRAPDNKKYGDVPGASVAGLVDAQTNLPENFELVDYCRRHLLKEGREEIGLAPEVTEHFELTAIQVDKLSTHHELTFFSQTCLSSEQLIRNAIQNKNAKDGVSFSENVALVNCTPEAISLLLCEIKSPFPATHAGPLLMLGYRLVHESDPEGADKWLEETRRGMIQNYRSIHRLTLSGYYSPSIAATEQGLPSFRDELRRVFPGNAHEYVACAWQPTV